MKKYLLILILLTSCVGYNDIITEKWIKRQPNKIICKQYGFGQFNAYILYSEIDTFDTGLVKMILNDTIYNYSKF